MILRPLYGMFASNSLINTYNNILAESKEKIHEYDDEELYEIYSLLARQEAGRSSFGSQQLYLQKESSMRFDLIKKHSDYIASHPECDYTLPQEIVDQTIAIYLDGYKRLTGKDLA